MPRVTRRLDFDRKFQAKLVRALFQFPEESRDIIETIDPNVFESAPARWTVSKLKSTLKATGSPATWTVIEYEAMRDVKRGLIKSGHALAFGKFLDRLQTKVPDKTYLLDKANDYARFVAAEEFVVDLARRLEAGAGSMDWKYFEKALDKQRQFGNKIEGSLGQGYFQELESRYERRRNIAKIGIKTGIDFVDQNMRQGGLPPKQLGVIMAPPGWGKSSTLVYMSGSAALQGKRSLYLSLELDEDTIAEKHDARFSGIEIGNLIRKESEVRRRIERKFKRMKNPGDLVVKYVPPYALNVSGLKSLLMRLQASAYYPDVVFIDYADNMSLMEYGGSDSDSDYGPLGRLYVALRGLAGELNIPIWTASQTNRTALNKAEMSNIGMQHLGDSFKKAAVADVIVAISDDNDSGAPKSLRTKKFTIIKNRNGQTGLASVLRFDPGRSKISEK